MRYANINTADGTIREFRDFDEKPEDIPHKNVAWVPAARVDAPSYNPATQVLEGPSFSVRFDDETGRYYAVIEQWVVRDKTPDELSADIDAKIARLDETTRKALEDIYTRLTALEGKQSAGGFRGFLRSLFGG